MFSRGWSVRIILGPLLQEWRKVVLIWQFDLSVDGSMGNIFGINVAFLTVHDKIEDVVGILFPILWEERNDTVSDSAANRLVRLRA